MRVNIGGKSIGGDRVFIVGEIGINHNGSLDIAKKLVDVAVEAGCDAVKFQKRTIGVVYTEKELGNPRENPFGITNGDLKRGLEFGPKEYNHISLYCKKRDIVWFASPWDEDSVDFLEPFDLPCYKIASASLTDIGLLKHVKDKGRPVIISTGMSTMIEIENAVDVLGTERLIILHAVSTYPAENCQLNLRVIRTLQKRFPTIPIGYSGHERGTSLSVNAVALGACVIERHITLDRTMWGSDQSASLEPKGLNRMVRDIRNFEIAVGNGVKSVLEEEIPIRKKLRRK